MSTVRYALGVDLGTTYTCAAVADDGAPRVAQLTGTSHTIPSVVSVTDDGLLAGEAAERRIISHPTATAREFKRRFGDPAPIVLDGQTYGADALTAALLREVVRRVETAEGSAPAAVALAHPASWGPFRLDLLRAAATQAGLDDVQLVPEPVAAAVANSDRVEPGSLVAVYDLGGGTFDAAVVRCSDDWPVVGTPEGVERLGGIDFDQAVLAHVDQALDGQVFALDSSDPDTRSALMRLRAECQRAKEHLSQDTDVDIPVVLPNLQTSVRLTRSEFEAMVRPRLADSVNVLDRVIASAGAQWDDISAVLLVGGSSSIPAVGQLVAEHTGRPVIAATNPHLAIALGTAAIAQRDIVRSAAPAAAAPTTTAPTTAAPMTGAEATAPPASAAGRSAPIGLIVAGVAAIALAIGAFVAFGGGGDSESADPPATLDDTSTAPADAAPGDTAPGGTATGDGSTADTGTVDGATADTGTVEPPDTTVDDGTAVPDSGVASIDICATDLGDVERFAATNDDVYFVSPAGLTTVAVSGLTDCSLDISAAVAADVGQPADVTDVAAFDTALALSAPAGGGVLNQSTGTFVSCPALTGAAAVTDDGTLFVLTGDTVERYQLDRDDGCTLDDSSAFADVAATSVAVGGRNRLAVTGSDRASGAAQLLLFEGPRNSVVVDGFDRLDGVVRCGDLWCALDVAAAVVHVVAADGTVVGAAPLASDLPAPVSELLDVTSTRDATFVLVRLADGTTPVLRLSV